MDVVFRFIILAFLLTVDGHAVQQHEPHKSLIYRHLQREENESDSAATDFLAEVTAAILKDDPAADIASFVALIDGLASSASESNEPSFRSNRSSTVSRSDGLSDEAGGDGDAFEGVGSDFAPIPESSSTSSGTDASISFDQVVGSNFSASNDGGRENSADTNMAGGKENSNSLAMMQQPRYVVVAIIVLHVLAIIYEVDD